MAPSDDTPTRGRAWPSARPGRPSPRHPAPRFLLPCAARFAGSVHGLRCARPCPVSPAALMGVGSCPRRTMPVCRLRAWRRGREPRRGQGRGPRAPASAPGSSPGSGPPTSGAAFLGFPAAEFAGLCCGIHGNPRQSSARRRGVNTHVSERDVGRGQCCLRRADGGRGDKGGRGTAVG